MKPDRKMAWVAIIDKVEVVENSDSLEVCTVGGWKCVTRRGEFKQGERVVYLSIDSWVPHELAPFLSKGKEPREFNGVKGERLRTVKLRGQVSQGLLLKFSDIPLHIHTVSAASEGEDLTLELGIQKWEAPIPACLAGQVRGNFPSFLRKSDQERVQNLAQEIFGEHAGEIFEVTVKLDGSSCTTYVNQGLVGVCSRNLDLTETDSNAFWQAARKQKIIEALSQFHEATGRNIALQSELIGPGIQGNPEGLSEIELFLFNIYDIDRQEFVQPIERFLILASLVEKFGASLKHSPVLDHTLCVSEAFPNVEAILAYAEGPSLNPKVKREGLVFKSHQTGFSFKAISNSYLLKNKNS